MDTSKLNNWLQVTANIGIVLGLLLVGVQLKQNSDLTRIQILYDESRRQVDLELQVVGERGAEVWAKSIREPENLALDEIRIMEALLWSFLETQRGTHRLALMGLIEDEDWRKRVNAEVEFYLGNPYALAWWQNISGGFSIDPQLKDAINARILIIRRSTEEYITGPMDYLEPPVTTN
ncbi:MAG: hypothetical protein WBM57_07540 [Woeseiaceae bacterium]